MHILCRIGFHRWEHHTSMDSLYVTQWARCRRDGCRFYYWMLTDRARRIR